MRTVKIPANVAKALKLPIVSNEREDEEKAKELVNYFYKKYNKNMKKVRQAILDNIVNNKYTNNSNSFVDKAWDEFKRVFPS